MAGCDQGSQADQSTDGGASIHFLASNVSAAQPLAPGGRIELAFDRLLLPASVTRQSFVLVDLRNNALSPFVAYDPVTRVVAITPMTPLPAGLYRVVVAPEGPTDPNGPRAIDGAPLANAPLQITFSANGLPDAGASDGGMPDAAVADAGTTADATTASVASGAGVPSAPTINFCNDVLPVFVTKCTAGICHGNTVLPAAGLLLDTPADIQMTAVGQVAGQSPVAHGSNTGPAPQAQPPGRIFGVDMPIIDREMNGPTLGDPGNSWLLYKLLMAVPPACSSTYSLPPCGGSAPETDAGASDTGTTIPDASSGGEAGADAGDAGSDSGVASGALPIPTDVSHAYDVAWVPMTSDERLVLSNLIPGREMPFPSIPLEPLGMSRDPLTLDELERISLWIAQGSPVPNCP